MKPVQKQSTGKSSSRKPSKTETSSGRNTHVVAALHAQLDEILISTAPDQINQKVNTMLCVFAKTTTPQQMAECQPAIQGLIERLIDCSPMALLTEDGKEFPICPAILQRNHELVKLLFTGMKLKLTKAQLQSTFDHPGLSLLNQVYHRAYMLKKNNQQQIAFANELLDYFITTLIEDNASLSPQSRLAEYYDKLELAAQWTCCTPLAKHDKHYILAAAVGYELIADILKRILAYNETHLITLFRTNYPDMLSSSNPDEKQVTGFHSYDTFVQKYFKTKPHIFTAPPVRTTFCNHRSREKPGALNLRLNGATAALLILLNHYNKDENTYLFDITLKQSIARIYRFIKAMELGDSNITACSKFNLQIHFIHFTLYTYDHYQSLFKDSPQLLQDIEYYQEQFPFDTLQHYLFIAGMTSNIDLRKSVIGKIMRSIEQYKDSPRLSKFLLEVFFCACGLLDIEFVKQIIPILLQHIRQPDLALHRDKYKQGLEKFMTNSLAKPVIAELTPLLALFAEAQVCREAPDSVANSQPQDTEYDSDAKTEILEIEPDDETIFLTKLLADCQTTDSTDPKWNDSISTDLHYMVNSIDPEIHLEKMQEIIRVLLEKKPNLIFHEDNFEISIIHRIIRNTKMTAIVEDIFKVIKRQTVNYDQFIDSCLLPDNIALFADSLLRDAIYAMLPTNRDKHCVEVNLVTKIFFLALPDDINGVSPDLRQLYTWFKRFEFDQNPDVSQHPFNPQLCFVLLGAYAHPQFATILKLVPELAKDIAYYKATFAVEMLPSLYCIAHVSANTNLKDEVNNSIKKTVKAGKQTCASFVYQIFSSACQVCDEKMIDYINSLLTPDSNIFKLFQSNKSELMETFSLFLSGSIPQQKIAFKLAKIILKLPTDLTTNAAESDVKQDIIAADQNPDFMLLLKYGIDHLQGPLQRSKDDYDTRRYTTLEEFDHTDFGCSFKAATLIKARKFAEWLRDELNTFIGNISIADIKPNGGNQFKISFQHPQWIVKKPATKPRGTEPSTEPISVAPATTTPPTDDAVSANADETKVVPTPLANAMASLSVQNSPRLLDLPGSSAVGSGSEPLALSTTSTVIRSPVSVSSSTDSASLTPVSLTPPNSCSPTHQPSHKRQPPPLPAYVRLAPEQPSSQQVRNKPPRNNSHAKDWPSRTDTPNHTGPTVSEAIRAIRCPVFSYKVLFPMPYPSCSRPERYPKRPSAGDEKLIGFDLHTTLIGPPPSNSPG